MASPWPEADMDDVTPSVRSGRPLDGEFADYVKPDIDRVRGDDAVTALDEQAAQTSSFLESLSDAQICGMTYAPGKWTVKELIGHVSDDERIFAYRALCLARGDARALAGFDEERYVQFAEFEKQLLDTLLGNYRAVRHATLTLFRTFSAEAWNRRGVVNGYGASARGLAFHMAGHELHHIRALREIYGLAPNRRP